MPFETYGHTRKARQININVYKPLKFHYINYYWARCLPVLNKTYYVENQACLRHTVIRANLIKHFSVLNF